MNIKTTLLLIIFVQTTLWGQFVTNQDTLYGNEWIRFDQQYFKISVGEDRIYRIPMSALSEAGIPVNDINAANYQLIFQGKPYSLFVAENEYIEFYGRKNRGELDRYLYENPETMQLNPEFSNFNDTSAYFLTWNNTGGNLRPATINTDLTDNSLEPEAYFMHRQQVVRNNAHIKPTRGGSANVRYSHFDIGEGFASGLAKRNNISVPAANIFSAGPDPTVDVRFTTNVTAHSINLSVNDEVLENMEFAGYQLVQKRLSFPISLLKANNAITIEGQVDNFDRNAVSVVTLNYPRTFNMGNAPYFEMNIAAHDAPKYFDLQNFNSGSETVIYDPALNQRIIPEVSGGRVKFVLAAHNAARTIIIFNGASGTRQPSQMKEVVFRDYRTMDHDYIIISHPRLSQGPEDQVGAYAAYRASAQGGGYNTVVINVETLYDQFSYGITRHSHGVKNFVNYIARTWSAPKYVFIIGKGREYAVYRTAAQITDALNADFTVPTYGFPGSDNMLLSRGFNTPHIIIGGRLAAKTSEDIKIYLGKIKEFENITLSVEDRLWKKRVLHMLGAKTDLQTYLGNYLDQMERLIQSNQYGANVTTFRKSSTETIQESEAFQILDNIDRGVSILTFFGHSSVGTFDFNIDDVKKLKNKGKYPLVISLGCYSGNIHTNVFGISEEYILVEDKGSIGFLASSSTAYVNPQGEFGLSFYNKVGEDLYGASIGEIINADLHENSTRLDIATKLLSEQLTLHGDPAIKIFNAAGPDYIFDFESISTDPSIIETNLSEFTLNFNVLNLGKAINDSLQIDLEHYNSRGDLIHEKSFNIISPSFDTKISINFPNDDITNVGKNYIKGIIDPSNKIDEFPLPVAENNNTILNNNEEGFLFYSINNSAATVSPCNFGIYNKNQLILRASTYNALSENINNYVLEIDTSKLYNSPNKVQERVSSSGGLIEWVPNLIPENNRVYYWRISPDSVNTDIGYLWSESSFLYSKDDNEGWNQSHHFQFKENVFEGISLQDNNKFEFDTSGFFIKVFNGIYDFNTTGYQYNFENFAASIRPWNFLDGGIAVVVGEELTGNSWINSGGDFGSINTGNFGSFRCFAYNTNLVADRQNLINLLENEIPDKSFVFVFSVLRNFNSVFGPELWDEDQQEIGNNLYSSLENQGALLIRDLLEFGSVPYTFIYQKGVKVLSEEIGIEKTSRITSSAFIPIKVSSGIIKTDLIGPATEWNKVAWSFLVDSDLDSLEFNILGINNIGEESILINSNYLEGTLDLSQVDASIFPYLKLSLSSKDIELQTPLQIHSWKVLYTGLPDLNLDKRNVYNFKSDTIQQGDILELDIEINNISSLDIHDISADVNIIDSNNKILSFNKLLPNIPSNSSFLYSFKHNTSELSGRYQLSLAINNDEKQKEKNLFNNFGVREFFVLKDVKNPILSVSFDGQTIIDGDLVSPKPIINIELKDENPFLLIRDPDLFEIKLIFPNKAEENIVSSDSRVSFYPASTANNRAIIEFKPQLTMDGIYTLKVNAKDVSQNLSGTNNFEISFQVINEQMISDVFNYPNPFSTSTEFIFTLTGSELPQNLKIEIMTVSGRIVKEIFLEELGPLRIGVNRTKYKWDGTDEYGQRLANGVYLYKVKVTDDQNEDYKKYEINEIQKFFKNNIGKLVILR